MLLKIITNTLKKVLFIDDNRLRVASHFSSGIVERTKRERVKITPREKRGHAAGTEKNVAFSRVG